VPTYRDTTSDTLHDLDPETFGPKLLKQLLAEGLLVEEKPKAPRKAPAANAELPAELED
jgi:hypothetical protein